MVLLLASSLLLSTDLPKLAKSMSILLLMNPLLLIHIKQEHFQDLLALVAITLGRAVAPTQAFPVLNFKQLIPY